MKEFDFIVDKDAPVTPTDYSWQFGIGCDHAYMLHRSDVCEHLKFVHDELGIKSVRFHGIFDDDMLTVQSFADYVPVPGAEKIKELNFRQVAHVYDNVLKTGMKPFVELSFMPSALASGTKTGLHYKNNITMPKDLYEWSAYIKAFVNFLIERYGKEEVESWKFEVWNEPDLPYVFFDASMEDYFALYAATARAIKEADRDICVGGPSTSGCKWIPQFINFCKENDLPCDFVTTHHYPGDAFGNTVSAYTRLKELVDDTVAKGLDLTDGITNIFYHLENFEHWTKGGLTALDRKAREEAGDKPLYISEWNCCSVFGAPVHDEKYAACFIVKTCLDSARITDGYMFWCCSDIFEEILCLNKPFVGSFGLVSIDGIPKPNFWAFKMLKELYPDRLVLPYSEDDVEIAAFKSRNKLQILVYAQNAKPTVDEQFCVAVKVNMEAQSVKMAVIDDENCNPKGEWEKLGKPDILTPVQVAEIKNKTVLKWNKAPFKAEGGQTVIELTLRTNDVFMLTLE